MVIIIYPIVVSAVKWIHRPDVNNDSTAVNKQGKGIIIFRQLQSNENNAGEYNKRGANLQMVGNPVIISVFLIGPQMNADKHRCMFSMFICIYPGQKIFPV